MIYVNHKCFSTLCSWLFDSRLWLTLFCPCPPPYCWRTLRCRCSRPCGQLCENDGMERYVRSFWLYFGNINSQNHYFKESSMIHPKTAPSWPSYPVLPEVRLAGVRILPPSVFPQAGVVVSPEGVVREVLNVTPSVRPSLPSLRED